MGGPLCNKALGTKCPNISASAALILTLKEMSFLRGIFE